MNNILRVFFKYVRTGVDVCFYVFRDMRAYFRLSYSPDKGNINANFMVWPCTSFAVNIIITTGTTSVYGAA